ncbi:MAG TPA: transporter [Flavobacteriaceae bacterium]|nr:transporter [Flavobacteriaceae bacterium]
MKTIFAACLLFGSISLQAQYTETINSNRPGNSQGAFAVGYNVIQLEAGPRYGHNKHALRKTETNLFGVDYSLRYGLGFERLEVNLTGSYLASNRKIIIGASEEEIKYRNFESNTLGLKYLVYDPYRKRSLEKPNIRSWKANFKFRWRDLIPAVSVYVGANMLFGDNPYLLPDEPSVSPKAVLITQHNYRRWVFVMNFIADKFSTDFPTYAGIFTLTHSLNRNVAIFGEYQAIKSDIYSDDIARIGAAYLINKDFQVDVSGLLNFKDTPSRWQVALGVSYRVDMFHIDELIVPKKEKNKKGTGGKEAEKAKQEKIEELKEAGL